MYPQFDRNRLIVKPLRQRQHELTIEHQLPLEATPPPLDADSMRHLDALGQRLVAARQRGKPILLLVGAHVIRAGVAKTLIDLMERGLVTHIGMNGAGPVYDFEFAEFGATCESVARYVPTGEFGLWRETSEINDIVRRGAANDQGLGEALGLAIAQGQGPHRDHSILAAGVRLGIPVTAHVGVGYDAVGEHPNFDPASYGIASYRDFLTLCHTVDQLEGGVFLCVGAAVMGYEVYLKALAMARNVAHQEGRQIANFTTAAFDSVPMHNEGHTQHYYRPWKTLLVRAIADGGESFFVYGDHRQAIPLLRLAALQAETRPSNNAPLSSQTPAI